MDDRERSFLRAIGERPQADEPRLIYADWLEDRGDLRAELIRIQCRLARTRQLSAAMKLREEELLREHAPGWLLPFRDLGVQAGRFSRGMLEDIEVSLDCWLEHAGEIHDRLPTVHAFRLRSAEAFPLNESLRLAQWSTLRELDVRGCEMSLARLCDLAAWSGFPQITDLVLAETRLSIEGLFCVKAMSHLERLDLSGNAIGDEAVGALANGPRCTNIRWLRLDDNRLTDRGLSELMTSPVWFPLRSLSIARNGVRLGAAWAATASLPMPHLREVDFSGNPLAHGGDVRLSDCGGFLRLKSLNLARCGLLPPDVGAILSLRVLSRLTLDDNPLGDEGVARLAANPNFRLLRHLSLARTASGDIAANALAASPSLAGLQGLTMEGNSLATPAVRALHNASVTACGCERLRSALVS